MFIFINGTDATENVIRNSITLQAAMQERTKRLRFKYVGSKPSEYQEVFAYDGYPVKSSTSTTVTLEGADNCLNLFRVGDTVWAKIATSGEHKRTISAVEASGDDLVITVSSAWDSNPSAGEAFGKLAFGGVVLDVQDYNKRTLTNQEMNVTCVGWSRVFDKQLVNDTFTSKNARYIVNDFCNRAINYNTEFESFDYTNDAALQAQWVETNDGDNPTLDDSDYREDAKSAVFAWTNSGGTATFTGSPASVDVSIFTGASSGTPTKGILGFWYKVTDVSAVDSFDVHFGSAGGHYASWTITPTSEEWVYASLEFADASITGTPDWTAVDFCRIIITETADGSIKFDGIRVLEDGFFRHYPYVQDGLTFDNFRIPRVKPTEVMQRLADEMEYYWRIDDERYIHLFKMETTSSPFDLDETSDNFRDLKIDYDISRLVNRQVVIGAEETSDAFYSQVFEGDGVVNEWVLRNKFKNLTVYTDKNTVTDTMEAGTNSTTVNATGHGLSVGDYMVNRTRSNALREVLTVPDPDSFTVASVSGQTNGDTFSTFVEKDVGVEGINEDTGYDYMSNFNAQSIRKTDTEDTLVSGEFIWFNYKEVNPIIAQRSNSASITNMQTVLGYTDGIFDGQPRTDRSIKSRSEANGFADAILQKYSNLIITCDFKTDYNGLEVGQMINIKDTTGNRNINQNFLIQSVTMRQIEWGFYEYSVRASSLLYGMLELLQQLLRQDRKISVDEDAQVNNVIDAYETMEVTETVTLTEYTPPFKYEPTALSVSRYNLASYG